jgi:hypothetical protein
VSRIYNHRAFPRVPIGYRVKVVTKDRMIGYSQALNVSMGGILLQGEPPLQVGIRVGVAIFLADGEGGSRIVTHGTVVRSDAQGNAIQFAPDMEEGHIQALALLVAAHQPKAAAGV